MIQELLKGGARLRSGVMLVGWGFAATMSLLVAVSAYQNRAPDPFSDQYAALVLPDAGDVETTASIGTGNRRPTTEFGVFSNPSPVDRIKPGRFEAEIDTLRHAIVALRRSAEALRRQNDIMSDRLAMIESGDKPAAKTSPAREAPVAICRGLWPPDATHRVAGGIVASLRSDQYRQEGNDRNGGGKRAALEIRHRSRRL
ncbi:hypothetical protein [Breoghania sp.]|uniref:hypothetical protein n=1 Tax=Breoghania sp. TaxID=2065378 RepID=UPI0026132975|nr:hypothetical protein [Breoghania sp.]MDJ0929652.1 hypothetical protein [Breoghania sp.]